MTEDHTPLTEQQLTDIEARAAGLYEYATGLDAAWQVEADELAGTDAPALLAEVRRLRSELTVNRADVLIEVAAELEGIDFHPNAKATASDLCRMLAGRFRRKALDGLGAARQAPATT